MHPALRIEEILFNIFGHRHPANPSWTIEWGRSTADLAALARTCRTFKEPALDVLWSELIDLSPLAFCLPEHRRSSGRVLLISISTTSQNAYALLSQCLSFTGPRNDAEWDTLRSYTRRVWRIVNFASPNGYLDTSSISATFNAPLADALFPNLRFLRWQGGTVTISVVHFAVPLLTSLDIRGAQREDVSVFTNLLDAVVSQCPNIWKVRIQVANDAGFGEAVYRHLCSWNRLQVVDCGDTTMPAEVIRCLSRVSTLRWLSFTLSTQSPDLISPPSSPFVFSKLAYLEIVSESLASVTSLVNHIRLPAVQVLIFPFFARPSKATVNSYLSALHDICTFDALTDLRLLNLRTPAAYPSRVPNRTPRLDLDDVRPCMAFRNLRAIHINLEWPVDLTDGDMLTLVAAWPHIEHLVINDRWGWRTAHGITLEGLQQILQRCGCLWELCMAIDTESVAEMAARPLDVDLSLRKAFRLNVADSAIRQGSVSALSAVLSVFGFSHGSDRFFAWNGSEMGDVPGANNARYLWNSVFF